MFDLGWMELLIIGIVALIVVGPKDLPVMFKTVGKFVGNAKRMAREFQSTMNAAASESGLKETTDVLRKIDAARDPKVFFEKTKADLLDDKVKNRQDNEEENYLAKDTRGNLGSQNDK